MICHKAAQNVKGLHDDRTGDRRLPEAKALDLAHHGYSDTQRYFGRRTARMCRYFRNFVFNKSPLHGTISFTQR